MVQFKICSKLFDRDVQWQIRRFDRSDDAGVSIGEPYKTFAEAEAVATVLQAEAVARQGAMRPAGDGALHEGASD